MDAAPRPDTDADTPDAPPLASAADAEAESPALSATSSEAPAPAAGPAPGSAEPDGMRARVLVIACVDFRFADPLIDWLRGQGLQGQYDLRTHESASLAVDRWIESAVAINRLHDVEAIWIVDHDDCGAYRLAGEPNTRENHAQRLKAAQARAQAWIGKPVRIFFHPLGPGGRGAAKLEEVT